ncbi:MAG TPA: hypothetical protein VLB44_11810 [Kofleriaceae bacterium]|nr:hypothetical protein [Kofleriaceae bacterium]
MQTNETVTNGHGRFSALQEWFHERVEAAKASPSGGRLRAMGAKATEGIKAHPIAAAAVAVTVGYLIVRAIRR